MPGSLTPPLLRFLFEEKQAMRVFVVAIALLIGLAQGVPVAQQAAITATKFEELSSALTARCIIVIEAQR